MENSKFGKLFLLRNWICPNRSPFYVELIVLDFCLISCINVIFSSSLSRKNVVISQNHKRLIVEIIGNRKEGEKQI